MFDDLSPTDVAFVFAALVQASAAVLWLSGSLLIGVTGRAARYWACFAGLSALSFVFLVAAMHAQALPASAWLRAAGNMSIVVALLALHWGLWSFTGQAPARRWHVLVLAAALIASWVGLDPANGPLRVGALSGIQGLLALAMARGLYRYGRDVLRLSWPALLPLPLLLAAAVFMARAVRALLVPDSVLAEMTVHSGLNVGSVFAYIVLALSLHAMLLILVVMRLVADLRRLSRHDGLTGILNRGAIEEALGAQLQRSRRSGEPFCMLMLDADNFKRINDRWGHPTGDLALQQVATALSGDMREVDRLGRFGGEEFLVLLPGLQLAAAVPVAERLRERVAHSVLLQGEERIALSVSIGVAQWAGPQEDASRLLVRADAALYRAKHMGRNQVVADPTQAPAANNRQPA